MYFEALDDAEIRCGREAPGRDGWPGQVAPEMFESFGLAGGYEHLRVMGKPSMSAHSESGGRGGAGRDASGDELSGAGAADPEIDAARGWSKSAASRSANASQRTKGRAMHLPRGAHSRQRSGRS